MERYNGILKSRTKTMLHLQNPKSVQSFVNGFNIHYNFIKPHSTLNNITPAQAIGVTNKKFNWFQLISESQNNTPRKTNH